MEIKVEQTMFQFQLIKKEKQLRYFLVAKSYDTFYEEDENVEISLSSVKRWGTKIIEKRSKLHKKEFALEHLLDNIDQIYWRAKLAFIKYFFTLYNLIYFSNPVICCSFLDETKQEKEMREYALLKRITNRIHLTWSSEVLAVCASLLGKSLPR